MFLGADSAGAGEGDYFAAKLLFPLPVLLGLCTGTLAGLPIVIALIQYPGIGALGLLVRRKANFLHIAVGYLAVSSLCVTLVLLHPSGQFH